MDRIYQKGSEWRKWDLQTQTILDEMYVSIDSYVEELKIKAPDSLKELVRRIGSEKLIKTYDSKEYFFTYVKDSEKKRAENYAKLFVNYIDIFNDNIGAICVTDHNYDHPYLLDALVKETENFNFKIIPGVEINVQGVHFLILFREKPYGKITFSEGIKTFLTKINITDKKTNNILTICNKSYTDVIDEVNKIDAMIIYPHCNSSNGLFQERGKTDRTQLADQFNYQSFNLLQTPQKKSSEIIDTYIKTKQELKSGHTLTLGTDARALKNIAQSDKDGNFCWIKADPTFDGLRQVEYEPDERVKLQETNPYYDNTKYTIDFLSVTNSNAIEKQIIPFNRDLVAIIGGKGSGKSLLLSIIAAMGDKYVPHEAVANSDTIIDYAFVNKTGELQLFNTVDISTQTEYNEPIFYVEQEELAKESKNKAAVRATYLKEIGIYDQAANYQPISDVVDRLLGQIHNFESSINSLEDKTKYHEEVFDEKILLKDFLDKKINGLKKTIEKTSSKETKELITEISATIRSGRELKLWIENPGVSVIKNDLISINDKITAFNKKLTMLNIDSTISLIDSQKVDEEFDVINEEVIKKYKLLQTDYRIQQSGLKNHKIHEDIPVLLKTLEGIQNELALYENAKAELENTEQQIQALKNEAQLLFKEDEKNGIFFAISQEVLHIKKTYEAFSDKRKDSPIFQQLFSGVSVEAQEFFNKKSLIEDLSQCFLKGKAGDLEEEIFGDKPQVYKNYFDWVKNNFWTFYEDARKKNNLKTQITGLQLTGAERLLDIVFKKWFEYISVSTAIENDFNGEKKEIAKMSTGELATVLLKLKLVTEGLNKQIILLDQPEDHLDNSFIADGLVDLLKKLKKERQVIIATHNANLVVGTDAEQVIIAHGLTKTYTYGGIENPQIKEGIINILEGGAEAFKKRMNRYK